MRNPKRINIILKYLGYYWKKNPDLRLCQLLGNIAAQKDIDVYYYEDKELLKVLKRILGKK